jgi:MFS family permease
MFQALRIRDFRLTWAGGLVSALGSWLLTLAIPTHIFLVTGSLRATGLTVAAEYLPLLLLGPVAGVFADRWDRRRLMIGTNLFCAAAVAIMLLGLAPGRYGVLYAALVAENAGVVLYAPAWQARTPAVVGTGSLLSSANALNAASSGVVRLIGGPLGGILLALCGARWLIGIDAASYLLSALALARTSRTPTSRTPTSRSRTSRTGTAAGAVVRDLLEGARVLVRHPVARALFPVTVVYLAANASLSAVLIVFGIQRLGGSEATGFLLAGLGVGFLAGAPVIRLLLDRVQPRLLLSVTLTGCAVAYVGLFTSSSLATALPAAAAVGMFGSMSLVIPQTIMQRVVPNAVLGRISAVFLTGEAAATLAGAAAGPFLAQAAGLTVVAVVAGLVTLAAAGLAWTTFPVSADPLALSNPWLALTSTISPRPPTRRTAPLTPARCRRGTRFPRRKNRRGERRSPRSPPRMIPPSPTPGAASRSPFRSVTRPRSSTPSSPRGGRARWSSTTITPRATMPSSSRRTATGSSRTWAPPTAPGSTTAASSKPSASSAATK